MKNKVMVGIAIIMAISLVTLMPTLPTANAQSIGVVVLSKASGANGYVGPTTTITLAITYQGLTTKIDVQVQGADAYDAAAGALIAIIYTDYHGSFMSFGTAYSVSTKSWEGSANWESYTIRLIGMNYTGGSNTAPIVDKSTCPSTGYATVIGGATAIFEVVHSTWWGAVKDRWTDRIPLNLGATISCSYLR